MLGGLIYYLYKEGVGSHVYLCLAYIGVNRCQVTIFSLVYGVGAYCSLDVQVFLRGTTSSLTRVSITTIRSSFCRDVFSFAFHLRSSRLTDLEPGFSVSFTETTFISSSVSRDNVQDNPAFVPVEFVTILAKVKFASLGDTLVDKETFD